MPPLADHSEGKHEVTGASSNKTYWTSPDPALKRLRTAATLKRIRLSYDDVRARPRNQTVDTSRTEDFIAPLRPPPPTLLTLPLEIRREILGYCLNFDKTAAVERWTNDSAFAKCLYDRIHSSVRHPNQQETSFHLVGVTRIRVEYDIHVAVLRTCKQLYCEGLIILRQDNKYFKVEGLEEYADFESLILEIATIPFWRASRLSMNATTLPQVLNASQPDAAIGIKLTTPPGRRSNADKMLLCPLRCADCMIVALGHLGTLTRYAVQESYLNPHIDPELKISFPGGLYARLLKQRDNHALQKTLANNVLHPLRRYITDVDFGDQSEQDPAENNRLNSVEIWVASKVQMYRQITPGRFLRSKLQAVIHAFRQGEEWLRRGRDLAQARSCFCDAKYHIYNILNDWQWMHDWVSHHLAEALKVATQWACFRIATIPFVGEELHMQSISPDVGSELSTHALIALTNIAFGLVCPMLQLTVELRVGDPPRSFDEWQARLHLRRAKLALIAGLPYHRVAKSLCQAGLFVQGLNLAFPTQMYMPDAKFVYNWLFAPQFDDLFGGTADMLERTDDMLEMTGQTADSYWKDCWSRIRGRDWPMELHDRQCILETLLKVETKVYALFGKDEVVPPDFAKLLDLNLVPESPNHKVSSV